MLAFGETPNPSSAWLLFGDFNQFFWQEDKLPFKNSNLQAASKLPDLLSTCNLCELPNSGQHFTWKNNMEGLDLEWEIIDRGLTNNSWFTAHSLASLHNFVLIESDRELMIISATYLSWCGYWTQNVNTLLGMVEWKSVYGFSNIYSITKLKVTREALKAWNKFTFGKLHVKKNEI